MGPGRHRDHDRRRRRRGPDREGHAWASARPRSGAIATVYLLGEVFGALFFGRLSDKLGRKKLFVVTLGVYLLGNALTALTWDNSVAVAGLPLRSPGSSPAAGIGGEYAAINSAIDEMMPAKYRGRVDIAVNGTYWAGAIIGTLGTFVLLNHLDLNIGWRIGFLLGPVLGALIWPCAGTCPRARAG